MENPKCHLSKYNSDFELVFSPDLLSVKTRSEDGYEWLWRSKKKNAKNAKNSKILKNLLFLGTKANFGVKGGKYMYEVRIKQMVKSENAQNQGFLLRSESKYLFFKKNAEIFKK